MIHKPTVIPFFEKSFNWHVAKETSNSTTLKKKKKKDNKKVPTKKNYIFILLFIYKNHIKTMVLKGHCKHTAHYS